MSTQSDVREFLITRAPTSAFDIANGLGMSLVETYKLLDSMRDQLETSDGEPIDASHIQLFSVKV
jgi:hypothetical protein